MRKPEPAERAARQKKVAILTAAGDTAPQIAALLGINERLVVRDRAATGCAKPAHRPFTEQERQVAQQLLDDGCSANEVARTIGRNPSTIRRRFPDRVWSRKQIDEYLTLVKTARKKGVWV